MNGSVIHAIAKILDGQSSSPFGAHPGYPAPTDHHRKRDSVIKENALEIAVCTDPGIIRSHNEDAVF